MSKHALEFWNVHSIITLFIIIIIIIIIIIYF